MTHCQFSLILKQISVSSQTDISSLFTTEQRPFPHSPLYFFTASVIKFHQLLFQKKKNHFVPDAELSAVNHYIFPKRSIFSDCLNLIRKRSMPAASG